MALRHLGYSVEAVESADEASAVFDPGRHALLITDNRLVGRSGAELAAEIRQRHPLTPIVLYTGFAPPACPAADRILEKPVELTLLASTLATLLGSV